MEKEDLKNLYQEIIPKVEELLLAIGGNQSDANAVANRAMQTHLSIWNDKNNGIDKYWMKKKKALAFNSCQYELIKDFNLRLGFIESSYEKLVYTSNKMKLIQYLSKKRKGRLKQNAIVGFRSFLSQLTTRIYNNNICPSEYLFIPFDNYVESKYENYLLKQNKLLSEALIGMLNEKVLTKNQRGNETLSVFQDVILDLLDKAQKGKLKPRRSSLENYVKGACFNRRTSQFNREIKLRKENEKLKEETLRLEKGVEETKLEDDIPIDVSKKISDFIGKLPEKQRALIQLKANKVENDQIMEKLGYVNKNSQKTQWYKLKNKFKSFFKKNPELHEYLFAMATLLNLDEDNNL